MMILGLAALPLSVSAQPAEEDSLSSWQVEAKPAPEEPALELKLDEAGVEIAPTEHWPGQITRTPEKADAYLRVDRAWNGFLYGGLTAGGALIAGGAMVLGLSYFCIGECERPASPGLFNAGLITMAVGAAAMITSGAVYGVRKRQLRRLREAHYGTPRRVQWDVARSRLVF
jgi:hypothetical protein